MPCCHLNSTNIKFIVEYYASIFHLAILKKCQKILIQLNSHKSFYLNIISMNPFAKHAFNPNKIFDFK